METKKGDIVYCFQNSITRHYIRPTIGKMYRIDSNKGSANKVYIEGDVGWYYSEDFILVPKTKLTRLLYGI